MLKKLIAKLRRTLGPSPDAKPAKEAAKPSLPASQHPARTVHAESTRRRESRPKAGERTDRAPRDSASQGGHESRSRGSHRHGSSGADRGAGGGGGGRGRGRERERHPGEETTKPAAATPVAPKRSRTPRPQPEVPKVDSAFTQLGLSDRIAFAVQEKGYMEPTPIQAQGIPVVLSGRDVIGSAQTGTGKTAAFALPILQRLDAKVGHPRCLVLEPTRELALQVEEAFKTYGKYTNLDVTVIYGGVGYGKQREDLENGVDIIVATPGRLLDHMEQGAISLAGVEILVMDEVDRMLDMGFLPDVKRIVSKIPKSRQTLFFTATIPPEIASLASWALHEPVEVKIGQRRSAAETVAHAFYPVVASQKFDLLLTLLEATQFKSVIIFCRTKMGADRIAHRLLAAKHTVGVIHSDRSQRERVESLDGFKSGKFEVLVATDIAARGLDIAGVSHVINYDVPENAEDYVHRIGRTGRAQNTGEAFTLVTEDDVRNARSIERFINTPIERKKFPDFPYIYSALFDETNQAAAAAAAKPASRLTRGGRR
ncbi:MAG: DEAD/DEAH box helicase [Opitutaceae bacterium]|nr:DEAD/DEAH box helicase [Opitutaceae bacterium]